MGLDFFPFIVIREQEDMFKIVGKSSILTNYSPVLLICTPLKYRKTSKFSGVFRGV